jgi:hypothetical protein
VIYFIYESLTVPSNADAREGAPSGAFVVPPFFDPRPARTLRRSMHSAELRWFPLFFGVFAINGLVVVLAYLLILLN